MLIIRPIETSDYDDLMLCAEESGHGFTSLPTDPDVLSEKIAHSISSFAVNAKSPGNQSYLMVAQDLASGEIAGVTGIEAAIGLDIPFYTYQISKVVHHSSRLNVHNTVEVLSLGHNYTGTTEICTLFLRTKFRGGMNGKLLSKIRFLMMAQFPEKFADIVFAEMRGISDENGNSPFWAWLKEHFFSIDFTTADYLSGTGQKGFIAELMPKLPIYVNLLSESAQAVIGKVHEQTRPALRLLEQEGFSCRGHVDIFDAGPTVECQRQHIETIRRSFTSTVKIGTHQSEALYLLANTDFARFRGTISTAAFNEDEDTVLIASEVAKALCLKEGDTLRLSAL